MKNKNTNGNGPSAGNNNDKTPQTESQTEQRLVMPVMKTFEDAHQLARLEQDNFYISVFMIQSWLGEVVGSTIAQYAERKDPRTRGPQSGQTWRKFQKTIAHDLLCDEAGESSYGQIADPRQLDKDQLCHFLSTLFGLSAYEDPYADILREALSGYLVENGGPRKQDKVEEIKKDPVAALMRICDWIDSVVHHDTHMLWHLSPASFDPDPEKRELASLGLVQRHFAKATGVEKAMWTAHFGDAAQRFADSPKYTALATGLGSDATKVWNYPEVDCAVIALWPLVKRHNWTYADLLKTIRPTLKRADAYPCDREQSFATYCTNVLGLRKTGKGRSSAGKMPGADAARRLLALNK